MRPILILFAVFMAGRLVAQTPLTKVPLRFENGSPTLTVSRDGYMAITTKTGEFASAPSMTAEWKKSNPGGNDEEDFLYGPTLERAIFFNKDTGFVSGYIKGKGDEDDIIYHTTDGGNTWKAIDFGKGGWADDAVYLDSGEAWMSVSDDGMAYTSDYGFTWTTFKAADKEERFGAIYFNNRKEGLAGSLNNVLAYTPDNCNTWIKLPTPLDQNKYQKTNKHSRPELDKVAIIGDYYLVSQENIIFYSKRDQIDWVRLRQYEDFYTDPQNSALFFKAKGNYVRAGADLKLISSPKPCQYAGKAFCRNGSLYFLSRQTVNQLTPDNVIVSVAMTTSDEASIEADWIGSVGMHNYGVVYNQLYIREGFRDKWDYHSTLPFHVADTGRARMYDEVIQYQFGDSVYYYHLDLKTLDRRSASTINSEFSISDIEKISFEKGSRGCFHHYYNARSYKRNANGDFQLEEGKERKLREGEYEPPLPRASATIDGDAVSAFAKRIPDLLKEQASVKDLRFSKEDLRQCKRDILAFKESLTASKKKKKEQELAFEFYENDLDLGRMLSLVDSIEKLSPDVIETCLFNLARSWSTTTHWMSINLTNSKGEEMIIRHVYSDDTTNAFCLPWSIGINRANKATTSTAINDFVDSIYPGFLIKGSKVKALHSIVMQLYESGMGSE